jgi:hypothetical protein
MRFRTFATGATIVVAAACSTTITTEATTGTTSTSVAVSSSSSSGQCICDAVDGGSSTTSAMTSSSSGSGAGGLGGSGGAGGLGGSGGVDAGTLASPPPAQGMQPANGTADATFAAKQLYIGDTDWNGAPDKANGWKNFGYNIDGVAPSNLAGFCKPVVGASNNVHVEGINGIENSFGHIILQILLGLSSNVSSTINQGIAAGNFTLLFTVDKLGAGSSYNPIPSRYDAGGKLGTPPSFNGTDAWPVIQGTTVDFPNAYVVNDTWVSGPPASLAISLPIAGFDLALHLNHAVVTMNLNTSYNVVERGVISGVIPTADLQNQVVMAAGSFDPSLCMGPTILAIVQQIAQASDILQDGTQDPNKTCDGISIGLGFVGALEQLGPTQPAVITPNPCGPADAGPG